MTAGVFAEAFGPAAPVGPQRVDTRTMWLESFDGSLQVPFDAAPVKLLRGALGLAKAPEDLIISRSPGVAGGFIEESRTGVRPIMLPLQVRAPTQAAMWEALGKMRALLRYGRTSSRDGACYLYGSSITGVRRFTVAYVSGLEGEDGGMPNLDRIGLQLVAVDPWARDREERTLPFTLGDDGGAFLSDDPADTFETRALSSSVVFGEGMRVNISSEVEVHPRVDVVGPFGAGLRVRADTGFDITVPAGVPAGQTLTAVTNPRATSIRLNGAPAAGRLALPWTLGNPFQPGINIMDVLGTGATGDSRILISWRGGWESLFG